MEASQIGPTPGGEGDPVSRTPPREADVTPAAAEQRFLTVPLTANPAPLGLAGFALSTFILSMFNARLVNVGGTPILFGLILFYGGVAQFLAGMWEFRTGNTFGALVFGSYGAFWLALWAFDTLYAKHVPLTALGSTLALYLFGWAGFTTMLFIAALRTTGAVAITLLLLVVLEVVLGFGYNNASLTTLKWGGYIGIATAAAAWYTMFAIVLESTFKRWLLPVFPLARE
ncbi:MAG: acetate uptake transporter, partial [Solirubrobacteraceae bacterium]